MQMTAARIPVATTGLALTLLMISPVSVLASGKAKPATLVSISDNTDAKK